VSDKTEDRLFQKLYHWSLKYLELRPRSEKEVQDFLRLKAVRNIKKGWLMVPEGELLEVVTEEVIKKLRELKLVNDLEFAAVWVASRGASRSIRVLKGELFKKGISQDIIATQLSGQKKSQDELLKKLISKAKLKYRREESRPAKQKVISYLLRRGFAWEEIRQAVDEQSVTD